MEIKLSKNSEGIYLLELAGNLDLTGSNQLKEFVMKMIKIRVDSFIINLRSVAGINSAGVGALIYIYSTLRKLNCSLIMLVPRGPVLEALEVSRIRNYFTIVHTLKEALDLSGKKSRVRIGKGLPVD